MEIVTRVSELTNFVESVKKQKLTIGFVPTMGALHQGHLSLVNAATKQADVVIVSIFVNPTQFNNPDDLKTYPRSLDKDAELLSKTGCKLVFAPSVSEVYPEKDTRVFDFGNLDKVMEGKYRPGHFNGVAQVVSRLFSIVKPDKAFFGAKDFQQMAIIRQMTKEMMPQIEIVGCPIVREADGLALSSRNALLTPEMRKKAPIIAATLFESVNFVSTKSVDELKKYVIEQINSVSGLEVEYFEIVDSITLQPVNSWDETGQITGCITVYAGNVRLIDNVTYKS
jgi:pantoate--beta-alanine ligase